MFFSNYIPPEFIFGGVSDLDANAALFLRTARISDERITYAINRLVIDLKRAGIWSKLNCIYPFVGAAAAPHSINLKSPGTNTLNYAGNMIHNTGGALGAGSGVALTGFSCNSLAQDSYSIGFYARTQALEAGNRVYMGASTGVGGLPAVYISYTGTALSAVGTNQSASRTLGIRESIGFIIMSRTSLTNLGIYRNGDLLASNTSAASGTLPAQQLGLFSLQPNSLLPTPSQCALAFIGQGLSHSEIWNLTQVVHFFQNIMQRAV